jgi:hypothetical protein
MSRPFHHLALVGMLTVAVAGCDLDVVNENEPDRNRALSEPGDVEALVGGTFGVYFGLVHGGGPTARHPYVPNLFPNVATLFTATTSTGATRENVLEPRKQLDNTTTVGSTTGPWGARITWDDMLQIAASVRDALVVIDDLGLVIEDDGGNDVTQRARAFAKFMQGWSYTTLAMLYDQVVVVDETVPQSSDAIQQAVDYMVPWQDAMAAGIAAFQEAITIAEANPFTLPSAAQTRSFFATPTAMNSADFVRLAHTLMARSLVLGARTPQERAATNWTTVLDHTAAGLTSDFEVVLEPGFRSSILYARAETNTVGCGNCYRWDNLLVGHADVSGNFQAWLTADIEDRFRFEITTPDRRITGTTPTSHGAYTAYWAHDNGFDAAAGLYNFAAYQWQRHFRRGFQSNTGTAIMASVDENNLLRAEALLHTGALQLAADLINITPERSHTLPDGNTYAGLPAVTTTGVPNAADCVPKTDAGDCCDLLEALWYERMIETGVLDSFHGYFDSRGFGLLRDYAWTQAPVPPEEVELLDLSPYTFGGQGGAGAAVYGPVSLP